VAAKRKCRRTAGADHIVAIPASAFAFYNAAELTQLETQRTRVAVRHGEAVAQWQSCAVAALVASGDEDAKSRLTVLTRELIELALEVERLDAALAEGHGRGLLRMAGGLKRVRAVLECLSVCECIRQRAATDDQPTCRCDRLLTAANHVIVALRTVRAAKLAEDAKAVTPAKRARDIMTKAAHALRSVERVLPLEDVSRVRAMIDGIAATFPVQRRSGGRRYPGRDAAVRQAYILLGMFGKEPPGCTPTGPWHRLACVLYAADDAPNLLPTMKKLRDELSSQRITPFSVGVRSA
jgi:hypothetical protein